MSQNAKFTCDSVDVYVMYSGAQGEYAGLRVIKAYLESMEQFQRNVRHLYILLQTTS